MQWKSWRYGLAIAVLGAATSFALIAHAADNLDNPTIQSSAPLNGASTVSGQITPRVGFPAHVYTAGKDGMVKVVIETSLTCASSGRRSAFTAASEVSESSSEVGAAHAVAAQVATARSRVANARRMAHSGIAIVLSMGRTATV